MAWDITDVEKWLSAPAGTIDADELTRVIDSVIDHADRHYDLITVAPTDEHDQALIMQSGRLYRRKHSPGGFSGSDELGAVRVMTFDPDIARLLSGRLKTAGLFGPSANTAE